MNANDPTLPVFNFTDDDRGDVLELFIAARTAVQQLLEPSGQRVGSIADLRTYKASVEQLRDLGVWSCAMLPRAIRHELTELLLEFEGIRGLHFQDNDGEGFMVMLESALKRGFLRWATKFLGFIERSTAHSQPQAALV